MLLCAAGPRVVAVLLATAATGVIGCGAGLDRDAPADATPSDTPPDPVDGTPVRQACVMANGTVMSDGTFGRLDGTIVAVTPPGAVDGTCQPDADHVHVQVRAHNKVYDIAINVGADVHSQTFDRPLFDPAWSEGWHTGVFVEYTGIGLHSTTIPLPKAGELIDAVLTDLATANHISVYATGYGPEGAHRVHRNSQGRDGLLVTHPLRAPAHARAFSFSNQTF